MVSGSMSLAQEMSLSLMWVGMSPPPCCLMTELRGRSVLGHVCRDDRRDGFATEARHLGKLPKGRASSMGYLDHAVSDVGFLSGAFRAESHHNQRGANLAGLAASILVHGGGGGRNLGLGVAHESSRRD